MPLPFPDFAEPVLAEPLAFNALPYADFAALSAEATTVGETAAAAAEVAAAAIAIEPLAVLGAGLLAAAAAEAILEKLKPSQTPPKLRPRLPNGARVSGGSFARVEQNLTPYGDETNNYGFTGTLLGLVAVAIENGAIAYYLLTSNGRVPISSSLPANYVTPPFIVEVHYNVNVSPEPLPIPQPLQNPGTLTVPVPTPIIITSPQGEPTVITPRCYPSPRNLPGIQPFAPTSPGVLVVVPEIGIAFNFNPTAVQIIYFNPGPSETAQPEPNSEVHPYVPPQLKCDCPPLDDAEIIRRLKDLENCDRCSNYTYTNHIGPSGNSIVQNAVADELVSVTLTATSYPINVKNQSGGGSAPDVLYLGWMAFLVDGNPSERIPIQYGTQTFIPPRTSTGYCATFYAAINGTSAYSTRKRNDPADPG